jgi:hypothetical protein
MAQKVHVHGYWDNLTQPSSISGDVPVLVVVETFFVIAPQRGDLLQDQGHSGVHDAGAFVDTPQGTNTSDDRGRG